MSVRILTGDALEMLRTLPDESVHCCVTSPPYWGLRDYGMPGQIGLERTPEEWVAKMVAVFREVRRVLRGDSTCWLNVGDCYSASTRGAGGCGKQHSNVGSVLDARQWAVAPGLKPKDLVGIPWRLAFALQADGWWLRADIIWSKPNPMPESVTDRPTKAHEYVFLLSKAPRYYYDADAVREEHTDSNTSRFDAIKRHGTATGPISSPRGTPHRMRTDSSGLPGVGTTFGEYNPSGRNLRSVWTIPTHAFPEAHFATFPPKLVEPCIKAGTSERGCCGECGVPRERVVERERCKPGRSGGATPYDANRPDGMTLRGGGLGLPQAVTVGWRPTCDCARPREGAPHPEPVPCTVLDPFLGAGTTALVADRLGRDCIGIELNAEYAEMARRRVESDAPLFAEVATGPPDQGP